MILSEIAYSSFVVWVVWDVRNPNPKVFHDVMKSIAGDNHLQRFCALAYGITATPYLEAIYPLYINISAS